MKIDELNSKDHEELLQILGEDILERYNNEEYWDRDIIENYLKEKENITIIMKKYKITIHEYSYETEAKNEEEARQTAKEINWNRVDVEEVK
ncbi:MAG TPA: hypothetical protein VMV95_01050 [Bacillota bacterium]|nr:hypothetical protein [Bacillota bacterium]